MSSYIHITPSKKSFSEIITAAPTKYRVPFFQREYSWQEDQVEKLWEDLINAYDKKEDHFLGPITIERIGDNEYRILDGQQRIATLMIIFCALRDYCYYDLDNKEKAALIHQPTIQNDIYDDETFRLTLNYIDDKYFKDCILRYPGEDRTGFEEYPVTNKVMDSNELLKRAYEEYKEKIKEKLKGNGNPVGTIQGIKNFLSTRLIFVVIEVGGDSDAFKIFEGMNSRGLPLSKADLIKNCVCDKAVRKGYIEEPVTEKPEILETWEEIVENVGTSENLTDFIRNFWISKYSDVDESSLFDKVKEKLDNNNLDPSEFVNDLSIYSGYYAEIIGRQEPEVDDYKKLLTGLRKLKAARCYPLLLSARAVLDDAEKLVELVRRIEILTVRWSTVCGLDAKPLEAVYHTEARKLLKTGSRYIKKIHEAISKKMPIDKEFKLKWLGLRRYGKSQQVDYLLRRVEHYLEEEDNTGEFLDLDSLWVEHIMPRKATNEWYENIGNKGGDIAEYDFYKELIGNLTLLGSKLNIRARQKLFSDKRREHYSETMVKLTRNIFEGYDDWDFEAIKKRQNELFDLASRIWIITDTPK